MKILWVTNMPTMYRVFFFNELGRYCDLTVTFERYFATGFPNRWNEKLAQNFKPIFVKSSDIGAEGAMSFELLKLDLSKFDCIVISSYSSPAEMLLLAKLKIMHIPYMLEVDGGLVKNDNIIKRAVKKFLISGASIYFSTSDKTTEYLIHYGAKKENIVRYRFSSLYKNDIIPTILNKDEKQLLRSKYNLTEKRIVLAVGQFIYRKGFDVLLKAAMRLSNEIGIYFVGGEATEEYLNIKKMYNLNNVHFVGFQTKEVLKEYYQAADLFVLPTREDIWGLVINEAMANGLPIITTINCVSGLDLVEEGINGYLVPVDDDETLAERINTVLEHDNIIVKMGNNSLKKIRKYTIEDMAMTHMKIFEKYKIID